MASCPTGSPSSPRSGARPGGRWARRVERHLDARQPDATGRLFCLVIERTRAHAEQLDREHVAERVRQAVRASGLTKARFAEQIGTSASRLSTYLSGKVTPSAAMPVRIERLGAE